MRPPSPRGPRPSADRAGPGLALSSSWPESAAPPPRCRRRALLSGRRPGRRLQVGNGDVRFVQRDGADRGQRETAGLWVFVWRASRRVGARYPAKRTGTRACESLATGGAEGGQAAHPRKDVEEMPGFLAHHDESCALGGRRRRRRRSRRRAHLRGAHLAWTPCLASSGACCAPELVERGGPTRRSWDEGY